MKKPTIMEVLPKVWTYYDTPGNEVGGALHVVLDDGNVADGHVQMSRDKAEAHGDTEGVKLATLILRMSKTQRRKLCALAYHAEYKGLRRETLLPPEEG